MTRNLAVCQPCQRGHHQACDGTTWDFDRDEITLCWCDQRECA